MIGWSDIGYENPNVYTPNINNLALNGVIIDQSYAYPLCTP
jgi:arylsulfatase B